LACIYGRFEKLNDIKRRVLYKYHRLPFTILLHAEPDILEQRILRRHSMPHEEQLIRISAMRAQSKFIRDNKDSVFSAFDLVIQNDNQSSVEPNTKMFKDFVSSRIQWSDTLV
jgi:hypothetical protein